MVMLDMADCFSPLQASASCGHGVSGTPIGSAFSSRHRPLISRKAAPLLGPPPKILERHLGTKNLSILCVNDIYEHDPVHGVGGFAQMSTLVKQKRAMLEDQGHRVMMIVPGDFMSGSPMGVKYQGAASVAVLNEWGTELVVLGNHEFDFGPDPLHKRIAESQFKWLGANVLEAVDGKKGLIHNVFATHYIDLPLECGPAGSNNERIRVGFFGVCTQDTPNISFPGPTISFTDYLTAGRDAVNHLRNVDKVDVVVALTHLSLAHDRVVANQIKGIDVLLGGHDHSPYGQTEDNTLIFKTGCNATWLGHVHLQLDLEKRVLKDGKINRKVSSSVSWSMLANKGHEADPRMLEVLDKFSLEGATEEERARNRRTLIEIHCHQPDHWQLDSRASTLRTREGAFGDILADSMRSVYACQFAIINGGFLRGNILYNEEDNEEPIQFRYGDAARELPFPKPVVVVEIKGADLKEALDQQIMKLPNPTGSFPHISGFYATYDSSKEPGERVLGVFKDKELTAPLEEDQVFTLAITDFMHNGGDGVTALARAKLVMTGEQVEKVFVQWCEGVKSIKLPSPSERRFIDIADPQQLAELQTLKERKW